MLSLLRRESDPGSIYDYYGDYEYDDYADEVVSRNNHHGDGDDGAIHPELMNEEIYRHKVMATAVVTTTVKPVKDIKDRSSSSFNEVYPKDSPYTQGASSVSPSSTITSMLALASLWLHRRR